MQFINIFYFLKIFYKFFRLIVIIYHVFILQLYQVLYLFSLSIRRHVIIFKRLMEANGQIYVHIELAWCRLIATILAKYINGFS